MEPVVGLKVESIRDIARIAATIIMFGQPTYLIHFEKGGKHIYGLLAVFHDYYKLNGMPIFYYVEMGERLRTHYILVKASEEGERIEFSDEIKAGWAAIPILNLAQAPPFIEV